MLSKVTSDYTEDAYSWVSRLQGGATGCCPLSLPLCLAAAAEENTPCSIFFDRSVAVDKSHPDYQKRLAKAKQLEAEINRSRCGPVFCFSAAEARISAASTSVSRSQARCAPHSVPPPPPQQGQQGADGRPWPAGRRG